MESRENSNLPDKFYSLEDIKKDYSYQEPVTFQLFTELENPVLDSEGHLREKEDPTIERGIYSRKPVLITESTDIKKVHKDYQTLENKFDDVTRMFSMMMGKMDDQSKMISEQTTLIHLQNKRIDEQSVEIKQLTVKLNEQSKTISEQRNEICGLRNDVKKLSEDKQLLKLRIDELEESRDDSQDSIEESLTTSLINHESTARKWDPATGMRDTFSIFTPSKVLHQEKEENALRKAAFLGDHHRVNVLLTRNHTLINGRGMPDSICSLVRGFVDKTALMLAAQEGYLGCIKILMKNGACVNALDRNNFTALDYAQQRHHKEVSDFLKKRGGKNGADLIYHFEPESEQELILNIA